MRKSFICEKNESTNRKEKKEKEKKEKIMKIENFVPNERI